MVDEKLERVLEQHRELREMIEELREYLEQPRPDVEAEGAHPWAESLAQRLVGLHDKLYLHFREEEDAEVLEKLAIEFPHAERDMNALLGEHGEFLRELKSILSATLTYAEQKEPEQSGLRRRTRNLLSQLGQHEEEETVLLWRLQCDDLGAAAD